MNCLPGPRRSGFGGRSAWLAQRWLARFPAVEAFRAAPSGCSAASAPRTQLDQASQAIAAALEKPHQTSPARDQDAPLPAVRLPPPGDRATRLIGGPGAAVLWSSGKAEGQLPSQARLRLLGLAWAALRAACPAANASEPGTMSIWIPCC
jgi:hypothetical protein